MKRVALALFVAGCGGKGGGEIGRGGFGADGATQITFVAESAQNPAWRDGNTLAYTRWWRRYNAGGADLRLVRLSPGSDTGMTDDGERDGIENVNLPGAVWSPSQRLVYSSDRGSDVDRIWITGGVLVGGEPIAGTTGHAFEPSISPDGTRIAFEKVGSDGATHEIWVIGTSGAPGSLVPLSAPGADDRQPNWSPAGGKIVFQSMRDGDWEIFTMNTDGTGVVNVTDSASEDTDASWSPDGQWIVYSSDRSGDGWANVWAIPAAGGTPARITTADAYDGAPAWSPDGTRIAFESNRRANERTNLYLIDVPAGVGSFQ